MTRAVAHADWVAVVDDHGEWAMSQVLADARALAGQLHRTGAARPTILIQSENSRRIVAAALAVGMVEGTLALLSAHFGPAEVAETMAAVRPDAVVGDPDRLAAWSLAGGEELGECLDGWTVRTGGLDGVSDPGRWHGGVVIGMTSGSTGRSKGVVHGEPALTYATRELIRAAGLERGEAVGVVVPISAAPAFAFGVYMALELRGTAVLSRTWDPDRALAGLRKARAAWLMCVPTQALQLADAAGRSGPLTAMRAMTVGGGPMRLESLAEAESRLGTTIMRVFGMSECIGHTTPRLDDPEEIRLGRDGRPFPGTDLRVVDEHGHPLPVGVTGRAQVRGPSLFLGYAEGGRLAPPDLSPDGYLDTGDLMTAFSDGSVRVVGRVKDVIIRGGRNISIAEVEETVAQDPRVREVCAVPVPDPLLGERVAVLVAADAGLALDVVQTGLRERGVSKATWPEYLVVTDELPRSAVGKTSRADARRLVLTALKMEDL